MRNNCEIGEYERQLRSGIMRDNCEIREYEKEL